MTVAAAAEVPGILAREAVMPPELMDETRIPISSASPSTWGRRKITPSTRAMPMVAPRPGMTPMI